MDVPAGQHAIFNVLQVRPITHFTETHETIDIGSLDKSRAIIYAEKALGPGNIKGITEKLRGKSTR